MVNWLVTRLHRTLLSRITFGFAAVVVFSFLWSVSAEERSENANIQLENLKRRSAEERWQRIKRLYPSELPAHRRMPPEKLSDGQQEAINDGLVPPAPEQPDFSPRLSPQLNDHTTDWVLPARPTTEDDIMSVPLPEPASTDVSRDYMNQTHSSMTRIAKQDVDSTSKNEQKTSQSSTRGLMSRKISDISPFYDLERDSDIREFAEEKLKEHREILEPSPFEERSFPQMALNWEASNLSYYPLYFSDPALERTGHSHHPLVQPIASIARFGVQFVMLPYQMTIDPPCHETSPLGWYRPGECAPKLHYQVPLNAHAAAVEAAAVTGLFFIIP